MNGGSGRSRSFGRANSWGSRKWLRQKARAEGEEPFADGKSTRPHSSLSPSGLQPKTQHGHRNKKGECYGNPTHQRRDSRARRSFTERMDCVPERVAQERKRVHQITR